MIGHFFRYGAILQVLALVHYARKRPDGYWIWIIFMGGGLGAAAYLLSEALPDFANVRHSMGTFSRRRRIKMLQAFDAGESVGRQLRGARRPAAR
jgi:hypothetical protein